MDVGDGYFCTRQPIVGSGRRCCDSKNKLCALTYRKDLYVKLLMKGAGEQRNTREVE